MIWWMTLVGCGPQPTRLEYVDAMTVYNGDLVVPSVQVFDQDGERMGAQQVLMARSSRAEVVSITNDGFFCLKSGHSELTLQAGDLQQTLTVECQLVEEITATPDTLRVVLEREGERWQSQTLPPVQVSVLDQSGQPLPELVSLPVSSNPKVVRVEPDGQLTALGLGRSELTWSAGGKRAVVVVDVGRSVDGNIRLEVPPGGRQTVPLKPGLQVAHLRSNRRVTAWMESLGCGEKVVGTSLPVECEIGDRGSLVVENEGRSTARVGVELIVFAESGS